MPSPIAHAATGYALTQAFPLDQRTTRRKQGLIHLLYGLFIAVAPDLDFIPQILTGERYHHGFSHSLVFAIGFALVVWAISYFWGYEFSTRLFLQSLMLYGSHLLLDFFTQGGPGIQLLWPFTEDYFRSSLIIFPETHHSDPLFQHPGHLVFISFELGYATLFLTGIWLWKKLRNYHNSVTVKQSCSDSV